MKKMLSIAGNILFTVVLIAMVIVVGFMVKGKLDGGVPSVGPYRLYVVLSGSMSPTFDTGSIIGVVKAAPEVVQVGDIITFKSPEDQEKIITHRVVDVENKNGQLQFITRGDANNANDQAPLPATNLIGKEQFAIPYGGYVTNFASSKKGLLVLIVIPALLVIAGEVKTLWKMACEHDAEEQRKKETSLEQS